MKTLRKLSHAPLVWLGLLILSLGLAVALKWTVKAQEADAFPRLEEKQSPDAILFSALISAPNQPSLVD